MQKAMSLSARRAWIEIFIVFYVDNVYLVALRKESVDRNKVTETEFFSVWQSLSARRAWIEMKSRKM